MPKKKTLKKKDTGLVMTCTNCQEKASLFELAKGFMVRCANCGSLWFFRNSGLVERLRLGAMLCHHKPSEKACKGGYTAFCSACRIRFFRYNHGGQK